MYQISKSKKTKIQDSSEDILSKLSEKEISDISKTNPQIIVISA